MLLLDGACLYRFCFASCFLDDDDDDIDNEDDILYQLTMCGTVVPHRRHNHRRRRRPHQVKRRTIEQFPRRSRADMVRSVHGDPMEEESRDDDHSSSTAMSFATLPSKDHNEEGACQAADTVRSVFGGHPEKLRLADHVQLECRGVGGGKSLTIYRSDMWSLLEQRQASQKNKTNEDVIVAVEATHVCPADVALAHHNRSKKKKQESWVTGTNFVGVVHCASGARFQEEGARVASLVRSGGANARYVAIPRRELVAVPRHLDASEVACVLSVYLPAFQALHHSQCRPSRYSTMCLRNARVLVTAGAILEALAIVELAFYAGAMEVYVECSAEFNQAVEELYAMPLNEPMDVWRPRLEGQMDVVVDFDYSSHQTSIWTVLTPQRGRLVWFVHPKGSKRGSMEDISFYEQSSICLHELSSIYSAFETWESCPRECRMDLEFLCHLLHQGDICPSIAQHISLQGIPAAHDELEKDYLTGAIVCDPWNEDDESFSSLESI